MQNSKITSTETRQIHIVLFDGFSNLCLANFLEPFRAANTLARQPIYDWRCLSPDGTAIHSSSRLMLTPDAALSGQSGDILAVMPSYGFRELKAGALLRELKVASGRHGTTVGLDTGSWVLAQAGLLDGYRATIHWEELSQFEEAFPDVEVVQDRYVADGNRLTCSGALAAFDLAQALIADRHGPVLSLEVGEFLLSDRRTQPALSAGRSDKAFVSRVWTVMQAALETPLPMEVVAKSVGCSQRTLETRLRTELRITPNALYRRLRLNHARKLVTETDLSVAEIATRSGYENASAMTRAYRQEFGQTPRAIRHQRR